MKKLLSLVMCLVLVLTVFPATALAAEPEELSDMIDQLRFHARELPQADEEELALLEPAWEELNERIIRLDSLNFFAVEEPAWAAPEDEVQNNAAKVQSFINYIRANGTANDDGDMQLVGIYAIDDTDTYWLVTDKAASNTLTFFYLIQMSDGRSTSVLMDLNVSKPAAPTVDSLAVVLTLTGSTTVAVPGDFHQADYTAGKSLSFTGLVKYDDGRQTIIENNSSLNNVSSSTLDFAMKAWKSCVLGTVGASMSDFGFTAYDRPSGTGADGIPVDEAHFPDHVFRFYVSSNLDTDQNGYLNATEIANATYINCPYQGIASFKGLEYLTELQALFCYGNETGSLDVSRNTKLEALMCMYMGLTTLDLSRNTALKFLYLDENQLSGIDLSKNTALTELSLAYNQLTRVDLSRNTALVYLYCEGNQLSQLDLSANSKLEWLWCFSNRIGVLDLRPCAGLVNYAKEEPTTDPEGFGENVLLYGETLEGEGEDQYTTYHLAVDKGTVLVTAAGGQLPGDVNGDGTVNGKDLIILRRYVAGVEGTEIDQANADMNGDGTVNGKDLILLRRLLAG